MLRSAVSCMIVALLLVAAPSCGSETESPTQHADASTRDDTSDATSDAALDSPTSTNVPQPTACGAAGG